MSTNSDLRPDGPPCIRNREPASHQVIGLVIVREEGLPLSVLVLHERLDVQVEALRRGAIRRLRCQLALLKQKGQQREQRVPAL